MKKRSVYRGAVCAVILTLLPFAAGCPTDGGDPNADLGAPIINVIQGSSNVPSGNATVDFGDTAVGEGGKELSFTIENEGPGDLKLPVSEGLTITGDDAGLFGIGEQPDTVVAAGESTVFSIIFAPDSKGDMSSEVRLIGDHPEFEPYTFELIGTGTGSTISVLRGTRAVSPSSTESFGAVCVGTQNDLTFIISNTGENDLRLTGDSDPLMLNGADETAFTVVTQPATAISPGCETLFVMRFAATEVAGKTALLTFETNDPDVPVFSITVQAIGIEPVAMLPETGYSVSYANFDDGYYDMGAAWPIPRFIDNGNGTITDHLTGLMWDQNGNRFGQRTWTDALSDISELSLGGYSDWRMPNIVELRSLINPRQSDSAAWLIDQGFADVQSSSDTVNFYYWTSTRRGTGSAYMYKMINGMPVSYTDDTFEGSVWAVRTGATGAISLPKTGQTTSYAERDDGNLQIGVEWPSPRFLDNGFGALTDLLTGLMWQQSPPTEDRERWYGAMQYASDAELGGYADWRAPNLNEFMSLVSYGDAPNGEWVTSQGFINGAFGSRWSSTPYWTVNLSGGTMYEFGSSVYNYLWLVRGGR